MVTASFVVDTTEVATQVVEAAAGIASVLNGFKILDIAKGYYNLYKQQREFYYNTFQAGLEAPLSNEVYSIPNPVLDYQGRILSAYNTDTGPFGGQATDVDGWWYRHAGMYNTARDPQLQEELQLEMAKIKSDWSNYLFRFEETYYDLTSDIRWRKRLALHNIGVKEGTAVASALNTSLGEYQQHVQDFSNQLATYGNGIAKYVGYKKGLSDTSDDFNRMEYSPKLPVPDYNYVQVGIPA